MIRRTIGIVFACCLLCGLSSDITAAQDRRPANLATLPIGEWLDAGETAQIPWRINLRPATLRMDQRLEVVCDVRIAAKNLNRSGSRHHLVFLSRVSSPDGEWLNDPGVIRYSIDQELAKNVETQIIMRVAVKSGDFYLWLILYDTVTGKHNVAKRRMRVPAIHNDPLPKAYARVPFAEFPEVRNIADPVGYPNKLFLPVDNQHPLQIEIISTLSQPEQWGGRGRPARTHAPNIVGALTALSQLELARGSLSITGLDLVRRQLGFRQEGTKALDWKSLLAAIEKATSPELNVKALAGRKSNGAFFRDYLNERIAAGSSEDAPKRVFIVLSETLLFANGSDLKPLKLEGDCHCVVYHLRFRLNVQDNFDDLAKFIKPLRPRTFNLITALELRKAIAEIIDDLKTL